MKYSKRNSMSVCLSWCLRVSHFHLAQTVHGRITAELAQRVSSALQPGNPSIKTDSISSFGRDVLIFMIVKPVGDLHSRMNFLFEGCSSSIHQSPLSAGET